LSAEAESDFGLVSARGPTRTLFLDTVAPTAALDPLPAHTNALAVTLSWQGDDGANGSGVSFHALEHRFDNGPWVEYSSAVQSTKLWVRFEDGALVARQLVPSLRHHSLQRGRVTN